MDSYSGCPSFLNLLNSQQPNTEHPTQNVSSSPCLELGGSEVPVFGTQWTDDTPTVDERKERKKWTPTEDLVLISAWLNTSKDPVVGNEQKADAFWKRIEAYFASSPKLSGLPKREPSHCKQRWGKINEGVCKFVGCYDAATKEKSSGQNDNDVVKVAHEIFFNDYKVKFTLEHAWRELRHDQKWCGSTKDNVRSKRKKIEDQSPPCSHEEDKAMDRPVGVKAAKAKAKRPVGEEGNALLEFQTMWEIKQKDLACKDKLSDKKLLHSLLAKTEPLSDIEMALKNKLINDMLAS